MMKTNETTIKIAGFGGQGVVLAGNILARGCMAEDKYVTGMVSYGVEMRGGTANATLVVSDSEIASPVVEHPKMMVILNQPSLDRFEDLIEPDGTVILNTSLIKRDIRRDDLDITKVDATEIAKQLGDVRVANLVAVGTFIARTELLQPVSIEQAVESLFSNKKPAMIEINLRAFREGLKCIHAVQTH